MITLRACYGERARPTIRMEQATRQRVRIQSQSESERPLFMAQERPNRTTEWIIALRKQLPALAGQFNDWVREVRKEPRLFWETSAVRYVTYLLSGTILILGARCGVNMVAAPPPEAAVPQARTADYHVLCSRPECGHHFVVHRKFGFSRFPVECPKCRNGSGEEALRCYSSTCKGRWTYRTTIDRRTVCAKCGEVIRSP